MTQTIDWNLIRRILLGGYVVVFLLSAKYNGIPLDRLAVLAWMFAAFAVATVGKKKHEVWLMMRDWFTLFTIYMLYDYSRGIADQLGMPVNYTWAHNIDKFLFFGHDPNAVLQHRYYDPTTVHWYDILGSLIYMTHFALPVIPLTWLRLRDRNEWLRYVRRFYATLGSAVVIFVLFPAAPPWMAARDGRLSGVQPNKLTGRGWSELGLRVVTRTLDRGQAVLNSVAAMPSLHAGCALLVTLWFTRNSPKWVRWVAMIFPASMVVTLVYFGEHFVVDTIAGFGIVILAWKLCDKWEAKHPPHDPSTHGAFDPAGNTEHELHVPHLHHEHSEHHGHESVDAAHTDRHEDGDNSVSSKPV